MIEVYIHIPFCKKKCGYCDFNSFAPRNDDMSAYKSALIREINESPYKGENCSSIFIGGGTPSFMPPSYIEDILKTAEKSFLLSSDCEITIEANPDSISKEGLKIYRASGINRLSIGVQSFNDNCLKVLGRIHSAQRAEKAFEQAREAGFENINIDLMFSYPHQSLKDWVLDLNKALSLAPRHISAYSLIIEENTNFYNLYKDFQTNEIQDRIMYRKTNEILGKAGYRRYEISNYAKDGFRCRHNIGYWKRCNYIGFGLSAHSLYGTERFWNGDDFNAYIKGERKTGSESLTKKDEISEFMFLGLRMTEGVTNTDFKRLFGTSLTQLYGSIIKKYQGMGLLSFDGERLSLTDRGIDVSNTIFADFLI